MEKSWFILHYEVNDNKKESPKKNKIGILLSYENETKWTQWTG